MPKQLLLVHKTSWREALSCLWSCADTWNHTKFLNRCEWVVERRESCHKHTQELWKGWCLLRSSFFPSAVRWGASSFNLAWSNENINYCSIPRLLWASKTISPSNLLQWQSLWNLQFSFCSGRRHAEIVRNKILFFDQGMGK